MNPTEEIVLSDLYEIEWNVYMNKELFVICAPKVGSRFMEALWGIHKTDIKLSPTFDLNNPKSLHISLNNLATNQQTLIQITPQSIIIYLKSLSNMREYVKPKHKQTNY